MLFIKWIPYQHAFFKLTFFSVLVFSNTSSASVLFFFPTRCVWNFFLIFNHQKIWVRLLKFIRCTSCSRDWKNLSCIIETILMPLKNLNSSKFPYQTRNLKPVVETNIFAHYLSDNLKGLYQLTRYHRTFVGLED